MRTREILTYQAVGAAVVVLSAASGGAVFAQDPVVFRAETRLVEITLLVTGGDGNPVTDLAADEISVRDNGQQQQILSFHTAGPSWTRLFDDGNRPFGRLRDGYARQRRALTALQAFQDVADGIKHIPGQKNLIWISSRFPIRSPMFYAEWNFSEPPRYSARHDAALRMFVEGYVSTVDINRAMRRSRFAQRLRRHLLA